MMLRHPNCCSLAKRNRGFTLLEVLITVAIIGILATVAFPSYSEYLKRGNRASARAALLESAQFMERFYAANDAFNQTKAGVAVALPAQLQYAPTRVPAANKKYDLTVAATANSFTLTATPFAPYTDKCANLTLTNTGVKGTSSTLPVSDCWR